ncbi:MAG TPA: transketolase [Lentisphaeria bacterium]|nr:MAG: transketolase [Lentisphaerae bacterium GWF2_38_69]HBM14831.1 transketolase [Lentisphaeria bacterium]
MAANILKLAADNIRILAAEGVQKANSGHPGMPMGCADYAFTLWFKYMKHNPQNTEWIGRDRFVLSAGHGSMLIYSLLHLFEYGLTMDDLKSFRQWGSKTPGHPEFGHTRGVEVTTGPLGSGLASAVGMAIAAKNFAARTGLDKTDLLKDQKIWVISGDGCLMEGCSHEAASLAGHLKLDNIILFYDSNKITIEGATSLACSDDAAKRFDSYGWRVIHVDNANDTVQIEKGIQQALAADGRPTIIIGKTEIAFGAPTKHGKNSAHGEPLGEAEVSALKKVFGFPEESFYVNPEVKAAISVRIKELSGINAQWDAKFNKFMEENPESAKLCAAMIHKAIPANILEELLKAVPTDKADASRATGGKALQAASKLIPALIGGAADLAPSTKTNIIGESDFSPANYAAKNLHFGIREFGMGLALNGMALYGTTIPYGSTFLVFSDYIKPAIRLACVQNLHVIYIFTHDSIYVGEDGPTHQPIEQLAMMRSIPGMTVLRPAEARETAHCYDTALRLKSPCAIVLTRQTLEPIIEELAGNINTNKGAYILKDDPAYDIIIIATGSEVGLAMKSAELLDSQGIKARIVSMPSRELFLKQEPSYRESVIPSSFKKKVSIEVGTTFGWAEFVGIEGLSIGIDTFGASAPYKILEEKFGFTKESVTARIKKHFNM